MFTIGTMKARQTNPVDREQRAYLLTALRNIEKPLIRIRKSGTVKRAERIVNRHEQKERLARQRAYARVEKFKNRVQEEMLFGDIRKALKILRAGVK